MNRSCTKSSIVPAGMNMTAMPKMNASRKLETGPAMAIMNSSLGGTSSMSIIEPPPSGYNIIFFTLMLFLIAVTECASSCRNTQTKSKTNIMNRFTLMAKASSIINMKVQCSSIGIP